MPPLDSSERLVSFEELVQRLRLPSALAEVLRYRNVRMHVPDARYLSRPLMSQLALRSMARRSCTVEDAAGRRLEVGARELIGATQRFARDLAVRQRYEARIRERLGWVSEQRLPLADARHGGPLYISGGLPAGIDSGGEVSHTAGVLNAMVALGLDPTWVTTNDYDAVSHGVRRSLVSADGRFADFAELPHFALGDRVLDSARLVARQTNPSFVYQRSSPGLLAGVELARSLGIPCVLEFNSSAATYGRLWGHPVKDDGLIVATEHATLAAADLTVVVSDALAQEVLALGAPRERVLVNPNGVDPDRYHPGVDGSGVRQVYGIGSEVVIGFVGVFRPYHGAEVLAAAYGRLLDRRPDLRCDTRLLMIGDGPRLGPTKALVDRLALVDSVIFAGRTPQLEGPAHMAACDILVAPHVPNHDGSRFFGSPTKLFEYMAMGRSIAASDLEQLGQVIEHGATGLLVTPGDPDELSAALELLVTDGHLRERLGEAARREAVASHTWTQHTQRILDRLQEVSQVGSGARRVK